MSEFDLRTFLPYLLNQAAEVSSRDFQRVYKDRYGLLRAEWRVLFHLGIYGRLTAREICERAVTHKTKISRAVARLEQRRFLTRERDEKDRRIEWLELTPNGQAVYAELHEIARQFDAKLAGALGPENTSALRHMLLQLAERR